MDPFRLIYWCQKKKKSSKICAKIYRKRDIPQQSESMGNFLSAADEFISLCCSPGDDDDDSGDRSATTRRPSKGKRPSRCQSSVICNLLRAGQLAIRTHRLERASSQRPNSVALSQRALDNFPNDATAAAVSVSVSPSPPPPSSPSTPFR